MSTVCVRRDIDVPSGDLRAIVEKLSELSNRECRVCGVLPADSPALDYSATIDVFDTAAGRVLVRWTATFSVANHGADVVTTLRDAVFRDFVDELQRQVRGDSWIGRAS
jgi:hypothetical protein